MAAAVMHDPNAMRRQALRELFAWIEGRDHPVQISVRPYCREHRDTLMDAGKTEHGQTSYYCPKCRESVKVRPRVV